MPLVIGVSRRQLLCLKHKKKAPGKTTTIENMFHIAATVIGEHNHESGYYK
jgi:hypothetical protein